MGRNLLVGEGGGGNESLNLGVGELRKFNLNRRMLKKICGILQKTFLLRKTILEYLLGLSFIFYSRILSVFHLEFLFNILLEIECSSSFLVAAGQFL